MTILQRTLHSDASTGPVLVFGQRMRTAHQLENKGLGKITSNPGAAYTGPRISQYNPNGGYYVRKDWTFDQETKSWVRGEGWKQLEEMSK